MYDLSSAAVGTKLFVKRGRWGGGIIETVERITPAGFIVTKSGMFTRSGVRRGEKGWDRSTATIATEDDIAGVFRYQLVSRFKIFDWEKLSAEDLKAVNGIVTKYK